MTMLQQVLRWHYHNSYIRANYVIRDYCPASFEIIYKNKNYTDGSMSIDGATAVWKRNTTAHRKYKTGCRGITCEECWGKEYKPSSLYDM